MASRCHIRQYSSEGLIYLLNSKQMINYLLVSSYMVLGHSSKLESFLSRPPFYILGKEYTFLGRPWLKSSYIVYSFIELLTSLFLERNTLNLEHVLSFQNLSRNTCVLFIVFVLFVVLVTVVVALFEFGGKGESTIVYF